MAESIAEACVEECSAAAVRDVELAEMHHRVANVLQSVRALLGRHAREARGTTCSEAFARADAQLHAFALLHGRLRHVDGAAEATLCCASYLGDVCRDLSAGCLEPRGCRLDFSAPGPIPLPATACRRVALLVTELVMNASKHAFVDGAAGVVEVSLAVVADGAFRLSVADDGVGIAEGSPGRGEGMRLVEMLARSLGMGCVITTGSAGTRYDFAA